jgi:hypothetical protein
MNWKKLVDTKDLIVFERKQKDHKIKIEARKSEESGWEVFKTKITENSSNLMSEYSIENKSEAKKLIDRLKDEKENKNKIIQNKLFKSVSIKRAFKEEFVEKWYFTIGTDKTRNFILLKFDSNIKADVVMNEKFRMLERKILSNIEDLLGLKELGDTISYELYYFSRNKSAYENMEAKPDYSDLLNIEFDYDEE